MDLYEYADLYVYVDKSRDLKMQHLCFPSAVKITRFEETARFCGGCFDDSVKPKDEINFMNRTQTPAL